MKLPNLPRFRVLAASILGALVLSSCGGGDPYAGLWLGSLSPNRQASTIVLDDGDYYMLYTQAGNPAQVAGLIQGSGQFHGATFTSADARNFNWEGFGTQPASVSGKLGGKMTVAGKVSGTTPFSISYQRDFDQLASIDTIVGSHTGQATFILGNRPATFVVKANGEVSTVINGCPITGTVVPRMDTNAFDLQIQFGPPPCVFAGAEFKGIAFYREETRQLQAAVVHGSRTQAIAFSGIKD